MSISLSRRASFTLAATVALLVGLIGSTSTSNTAAADNTKSVLSSALPKTKPPGGFASWEELLAYQARMNKVANKISVAGAGNPSIIAAPQNRALQVYWKGSVPEKVKQIARSSDVPVHFQPAAYTHRELVETARRLASEPGVAGAEAKPDGSGLNVSVLANATTSARISIRKAASVSLTMDTRPQARNVSRQADTPLFWGGSRFANTATGLACTNGFALSVPGQPNVYMLTAGHCGNNGQTVFIPGQPSPIGLIGNKNVCRDTAAVGYPNGVQGAIYVGPWNSNDGINVGGWGADFVGNFIFTSGATTGVRFGPVLAVDTFESILGDPCPARGPLTRAGFPGAGTCMGAPGDSGGAVYQESNGRAIGMGIISAALVGTATCFNSAPSGGAAVGSDVIWYAPLYRPPGSLELGALQYYGVGLIFVG